MADKRTMLILEVLAEKRELRFTRLSELGGRRQPKNVNADAAPHGARWAIDENVHSVVPPKVEYKLTQLGLSLGAAFCGVWIWVAKNLAQVEKARIEFDERAKRTAV